MAKVEGPLFSLGARGKIADAMVFFPWKGRHVVRRWVIPTNPQSVMQGYVRVALKAIGKFVSGIACSAKGSALDSKLYTQAVSKATAGLNWNAWLGSGFLTALQVGSTFKTTAWNAYVAEYSSGISATAKAAFDSLGTTLGFVDFALAYGYTTAIPAGLQLYFGAVACYKLTLSAVSPYNVNPISWLAADVTALEQAMTTNA